MWISGGAGAAGNNNGGNLLLSGGSGTGTGLQGLVIADGGTVALSSPAFTVQQTWNAAPVAFTAFKVNATDTASAASSLLADLQRSGATRFRVAKDGGVLIVGNGSYPNTSTGIWNGNSSTLQMTSSGGGNVGLTSIYRGIALVFENTPAILARAGSPMTFGVPSFGFWDQTSQYWDTRDLVIEREAADTWAQVRGTNAQKLHLYNTKTDASNYERSFMRWNSNVFEIGTEALGTGVLREIRIPVESGQYLTLYKQADRYSRFYFNGQHFVWENPVTKIDLSAAQGVSIYAYGGSYDTGINFYNGGITVGRNSDFTLTIGAAVSDALSKTISLTAGSAWANAATNLVGGDVRVTAGNGATASSGAASGGNIVLSGGLGYGTGVRGKVIADSDFKVKLGYGVQLYNLDTDASNYERGFVRWNANAFEIGTEKLGTGTLRNTKIYGGGVSYTFDSSGKINSSTNILSLSNSDGTFLTYTGGQFYIYRAMVFDMSNATISGAGYAAALGRARLTVQGGNCGSWQDGLTGLTLHGGNASPNATINIVGGHTVITGGNGSSGSVGAAHGGNVSLSGGLPYGTGKKGVVTIKANNETPDDAALSNSAMTFYLDEATNELKVRVRYSDGTLKTATFTLT